MPKPYRLTRPVPKEYAEQSALIRWFDYQCLTRWPRLLVDIETSRGMERIGCLFAIPNGSQLKGGPRQGRQMREEGLRPGVFDLCLPVPSGDHHGLFIEVKRLAGGAVSGNQKAWGAMFRSMGYRAEVVKGWEAGQSVIEEYLRC